MRRRKCGGTGGWGSSCELALTLLMALCSKVGFLFVGCSSKSKGNRRVVGEAGRKREGGKEGAGNGKVNEIWGGG